jgi:hypothetical protein
MEMQQIIEMLAEIKAIRQRMMVKLNARKAELDARHERMMACIGKTEDTELKAKPEENGPVEEHQEIPKENAAVKYSRTMKTRNRGLHQAAKRRGEPKKLTRGDCGSLRNLTAACRKVSRHAAVARCKRNVFWKFRTQENCGPRKKFSPARIRMTHSAKVTRGKEHGLQTQVKDNSAPRTPTA